MLESSHKGKSIKCIVSILFQSAAIRIQKLPAVDETHQLFHICPQKRTFSKSDVYDLVGKQDGVTQAQSIPESECRFLMAVDERGGSFRGKESNVSLKQIEKNRELSRTRNITTLAWQNILSLLFIYDEVKGFRKCMR